ncbi:MAG: hypothetical protein F4Z65_03700 [Acidobacteria bacterium]|nr:hypothetical protein [Acidobacteriota bacterium]MYA47037.1 hypothetical protein [Acidobacteriota bacterium]MYI39050.1 hypothetical protein [Acidobacteriota bacterium]
MRAIRKSRRGERISPEEHGSLLCEGLFRGLDKVAAEEEARYVVRYLLSGEDLSDIPPRGPLEARNWFAMRDEWGAERQTEKLRNMIAASRHDLDYWMALNHIAIRIQEERRWWPAMLADWDIAVRRGTWSRPAQARSKDGRPHYANDARNLWIAYTFTLLVRLGLGRTAAYYVIADELDRNERTVMRAVRAASARIRRLPAPWECWPCWPKAGTERPIDTYPRISV